MTSEIVMSTLEQMAVCLGKQFGKNCEVVIHELEKQKFNSRIIRIVNGHVSQRKLGDGPSGIVLEALKKDPKTLEDKLGYITKSHEGRILKSSTMFIRNEKDEITALFAINYDITGLLGFRGEIESIINIDDDASTGDATEIPVNVGELLENLISQSIKIIGKPPAVMTKDEKVTAIQFLNNSGAFLITRSGDRISKEFGISKFTMYNYIDTK